MPVTPTYPGVYIEEIPSGVRTIVGVSTSVTALIGYTRQGPTNTATQVFNFGDYERAFGGLDPGSDMSYAVAHYFQNGGGEAWVVRVAKNAHEAAITLMESAGGDHVLVVTAANEGIWGNNLRVTIDYDTANPASLFNFTVSEYDTSGGDMVMVRSETFRNLSMNSALANYAIDTIKAGSAMVSVSRPTSAVATISAVAGTSTSGDLSSLNVGDLDDDHRRLAITMNGDGPHEFDLFDAGGSVADLNAIATEITSRVQAIKPAFSSFSCVVSGTTLVATSGTPGEESSVRFDNASMRNATSILRLGLSNGGREATAAAQIRPAPSGTFGDRVTAADISGLPTSGSVRITIAGNGSTSGPHTLSVWTTTAPSSLEAVRTALANALNASSRAEFSDAQVLQYDNRLQIIGGGTSPNVQLTFENNTEVSDIADNIGLSATGGGTLNVALYALGVGATSQAQTGAIPGSDGTPPDAHDLRGSRSAKTGLYALENVPLFNILCLPNITDSTVISEAIAYCEERRAFMIIDLPMTVTDVTAAKTWLDTNASYRSKNAAAYFPHPILPDSMQNGRLRPFAASSVVAGLYARTDSERGVWKAPAGTEVVMRGVRSLAYILTDKENGTLNPLGLNCLRRFPVFGPVVWGARTLVGADQLASEWKYVPVRRLALYIEESLFQGTQWVVFEPNDKPLWAQIRMAVTGFMHTLFRQGAFQGASPREAYLVKCDEETTTQADINRGIVNILVGFAPLKPAEFVIIKIQQTQKNP
jgi:hypothetical protein